MKNFFQLGFEIPNVKDIIKEAEAHPDLWDENILRTTYAETSHRQIQDIWLRFNDLTDCNDEEGKLRQAIFNDIKVIDYRARALIPSVEPVLSTLLFLTKGKSIGKVLITKLKPGGQITPHTDDGESAKYYDRFHVVLQGGGIFVAGEEAVSMKTFSVWWFNNQEVHSVVNASNQDRIHLIVDVNLDLDSPYRALKNH